MQSKFVPSPRSCLGRRNLPANPATKRQSGQKTSTVIGIVGAVALLAAVIVYEGKDANFLDAVGIAVVFGGTVVAAFLAYSLDEIRRAIAAARELFREDNGMDRDLADLTAFARAANRHNIQDAEALMAAIKSPFLRLGLQMCLDSAPVDDILNVMNWRVQKFVEREALPAKFYRTLAGFAPAFGFLATLIGLVSMMGKIGTADVRFIGSSMAVALLGTFYGVVLANLVFKPVAIKIDQRTQHRVRMLNVMLAGIVLIRVGKSPAYIQDALAAMVQDVHDEVGHA